MAASLYRPWCVLNARFTIPEACGVGFNDACLIFMAWEKRITKERHTAYCDSDGGSLINQRSSLLTVCSVEASNYFVKAV